MLSMIRRAKVAGSQRALDRGARTVVIAVLAAALWACGTGTSLTEYVESLNNAVALAEARAAQLQDEGILPSDSTPSQLEDGLNQLLDDVRIPLQETADRIDPPRQVSELHTLLWTWHADFIGIEAALATRAGQTPNSAMGWAEFSESPEVEADRASLVAGKQLCIDLQTHLDETEARGEFHDVPWLPAELKEVVDAAMGCEGFPDDPTAIYRFPAP